MPDFLTIAFIGLAALGLGIFWRGWRGRRIDNHPWCRKCRYDLVGAPAGAERCPECGVDLGAGRNVRLGRRRRRPGLLAIGGVLITLAATWCALATGLLIKVNWNQYKPAWWLAIEARSADATKFAPALNELLARMERDELAPDRVRSLTGWALNAYKAVPKGWPGEWDAFVQRAWTLDHLDDEAKVLFARSLFEPEVYVQPATLNGAPAALIVHRIDVHRRLKGMTFYRCRITSLTVNGDSVALLGQEPPGVSVSSGSSHSYVLSPLLALETGRAPRVSATVEWRLGTHLDVRAGRPAPKGARWETVHSFGDSDFQSDLPPLALTDDEQTRQQLIDSLRIQFVAIRSTDEGPRQGAGSIIYFSPTIGLQAEIALHSGDQVISRGGDFTMTAARSDGGFGGGKTFTLELPDEGVTALDLVFEPRWYYLPPTSRPGFTSEELRFWYGRLRIADLPVQWFDDPNDERIHPGIRSMLSRRR